MSDKKKKAKAGSARIVAVGIALLASVLVALAASDIVVWYDGHATKGTAKIVSDDAGTATLTVGAVSATSVSATTVAGALSGALSGSVTLGAAETVDFNVPTAVNVTNLQPVTLTKGVNQLNGIGSHVNGTNTITLAAVSAADVGKLFYIAVPTGSTNLVAVAKTGTWVGPALELAAGEIAWAIPLDTNKFFGQGQ